jgi:GDP-L-fucose synthase
VSIRDLAEAVARSVGYKGRLIFDESMPDGTPQKLLDVSRLMGLGWKVGVGFEEGINGAYDCFLENVLRRNQ